ncbi:MAG: SpoIIE family protein phosphatase [Actinomycetota bacterium]
MTSDFELTSIADGQALPHVLLAALEETSSSVCITTADLDAPGPTIVYVNPAYCRMTGRQRSDVIGASPRIMQGALTDRSVLDRLRTDLTDGRRFSGETINYRSGGEPFRIAWSIDPVLNAQGEATHYVATQRDVTAEVVAERLRSAEEHLDTALVDALAAPTDAETAVSVLLAGVASGAAQIAGYGSTEASLHDATLGTLRASVDAPGHSVTPPVPSAGIQIPIVRLDGAVIGAIAVSGLQREERAVIDRPSLVRFAERAASVIAALGEYQRQRRTALRLQDAILPRIEDAPEGFEIASRYLPGADGVHVGGDWFDLIVDDDEIVVVVGDVSGHGIDAATTMARLQTLASAELRAGRPVTEVFEVLDRACRDDRTMATIAIAKIARHCDELRIWSAGHLPPLRFGPTGSSRIDLDPAPPLGYLRGDRPPERVTSLAHGDAVLFFTDGLVERRGEPLSAGLERLVSELGTDQRPLREVIDGVTDDTRADDDIAVLGVRRLREADTAERPSAG